MPKISQFKVVSTLPSTLEPDAVYYVRVGTGFDIYVTNSSGTVVAYPSNQVNPATVTNEEAQTGTEPGLRSWSPVRVWQAITAWWVGISSTIGRALVTAQSESAARGVLGLGTAATATVTTSDADATAGRVVRNGNYGNFVYRLNGISANTSANSFTIAGSRNYVQGSTTADLPISSTGYLIVDATSDHPGGERLAQTYIPAIGNRIFHRVENGGVYAAWFEELTSANAAALPISVSLSPATDNNRTLGASGARWSVVWAGTATISTSDAREKTPVRPLSDAEISAAIALGNEIGTYQWLYAIEEKGAWARDHAGLTVQRAIEVMQQHGLEPFNYGFICYDQWPDQCVEHPEEYDGDELVSEAWTEVVRTAGDRYSFRGEELLAFIAAGQAAQLRRIEARLSALEKR
ncbi:tail fiber domain-containing protein [Metapseudomonas otitidis]|uniref:tail fiber domain-containing protein n=1 Tax=Metapseudomonas otitidis TaxID=319939 RepID=UPI00209AF5F5|nr:tail fiber domain-containing protein [Pseudomonas otitidis]MCO7557647.1 tail fiber domain-containing protein [Pseudomonas otitidis]